MRSSSAIIRSTIRLSRRPDLSGRAQRCRPHPRGSRVDALLARIATISVGIAIASAINSYRERLRAAREIWSAPGGEVVTAGPLSVRVLGASGTPIVLLHGLVASNTYWGRTYDILSSDHKLIAVDLLGFGASQHPQLGYTLEDHAHALNECLDTLGVNTSITIAAHSLGTLVALQYAADHPDRIHAVIAFGPPLYPTRRRAMHHIVGTNIMARLFVLPGHNSERACKWMCEHRSIARRFAVLTHPGLPAPIAAAGVDHTWSSYSQTLEHVILTANAPALLSRVKCELRFVAGNDDSILDEDYLNQIAALKNIEVERWPGDHNLPLTSAPRCRAAIAQVAKGPRPIDET